MLVFKYNKVYIACEWKTVFKII